MADQNSYLRYKRDTRHLLYWMIHASNSIIKSTGSNAASIATNTTGQITVSSLVPMSKLIAEHVKPIPSTIYRIFQAVIDARKATHAVFQQLVSKNPDPEIEKSNISHKHFIDGLTEAFAALGGKIWASEQKSGKETADEDIDAVIFTNTFSALNLGDSSNVGEEEDAESDDLGPSPASLARPKKKSAKGKKGKGGKKSKAKKKPAHKEASIKEIPLESYRIIEDETGIVTDYLMAVYSLVQQWAELRDYVQNLWHEVAYDGLNSAVGGAMSNVAIAMVKQTQSAIFVDFPGHDSYQTVMNTITRGDPDKAQGMFHATLKQVAPNGNVIQSHSADVDVREQFMIHAYQHLLDFITDYQATRSGKPTKRMLAEIRNWDPKFDVRRASKEQRLKWRRAYTISWLYDLVNLYSVIVVQRNTMKGQHLVYDRVDWSVNGPWYRDRRLYGLNELAGDITTLAMQKPGTDIRKRILPHHVFQIQCIVDSMTVSRGWSLSNLRGHVLSVPAPAFRPRRDIDLFLDRENERVGHGYLQAVDILQELFEKDSEIHGTPNRHTATSKLLEEFKDDFVQWLGESFHQYPHLLKTLEPSRFSNTNANGLWEYSPFLCGVGLAEALELSYSMSFFIWDIIPEPMCIIHLHNMLVKKGYIANPVGLWATLQDLFPTEFFAGGKIPESDFSGGFRAVCNETNSRQATFQRRAVSRNVARTAVDLHGLLNMNKNRFFKNKSLLRIYREAEWIPERIPDEEIRMPSTLGAYRITQMKVLTDPVTGKKVLKDTPLTINSRASGMTDEEMIQLASAKQRKDDDQSVPAEILASIPEGYTHKKSNSTITGPRLLGFLKRDMVIDICGERYPLSSMNYTIVTVRMMLLFMTIEDKLKDLRHPLWVRAYEQEPLMMREKRLSLTALVLMEGDEECMQVIADIFQDAASGWMTHIYWEDLEDYGKTMRGSKKNQDDPPTCTMM